MAVPRKRRKARQANKARKPEAAKPAEEHRGPADQPTCWLCSRPLGAGAIASVLGPGMFEVHQRCYEQAMRS